MSIRQPVAYAGRQLNAEVNIIVPESTSEVAKETMRAEGAHVDVFGNSWDDAHHEALRLAQSRSGSYVHPFEDPSLWQGHASIIDECVNQCHRPDAIVLSVGGGGLLCGLMQGLQRHSAWRDIPIVTAETEGAESLYTSLQEDRLVKLDSIQSIAVTLGAREVAAKAFEWGKTKQVTSLTVTDLQAVDACQRFVTDHRVLVALMWSGTRRHL